MPYSDPAKRNMSKQQRKAALGPAAPPKGWEPKKIVTDRKGDVTHVKAVPEPQPDEFQPIIPEEHYIKGVSTFLSHGEPSHQWVLSRADLAKLDAKRWAALEGVLSKIVPLPLLPLPGYVHSERANIIVFGDPHFGMLAQARETGGANWDMKIAQQVMLDACRLLIHRLPPAKECLLVNIGDFFHFQDPSKQTPRGKHQLDGDGRFTYMAELGTFLSIQLTQLAAQHHTRVTKANVPGNHDPEASRWMNVSERIFFRANPRVTFLDNARDHMYWSFGKNLVGLHHGHTTPIQQLHGLMANEEQGRPWGEHPFRRWITGHHHKYEAIVMPGGGGICEKFPTLAPVDFFGAAFGNAERSLNAITLSAEWGEIGRARVLAQEVSAG